MNSKNKLRALAAIALACCGLSAHAAVTLPGGDIFLTGELDDVNYGTQGIADGKVTLGISELGGTLPPEQQVLGVPELSYSYSLSGLGSGLLTIEYVITNAASSLKTWTNLSFSFFAQVDGEQTNFIDAVGETWGAKQAGDPDKRQSQAWDGTSEGSLSNTWSKPGGAPAGEGTAVSPACATGCDAELALQWSLAALNPGESFIVRVGLSDDGQHLSSRYFTTTGAGLAETLTISGTASVVAVPEPQTWAMLLAGVGAMGAIARRQRQQG
jgi:hypothetical protein